MEELKYFLDALLKQYNELLKLCQNVVNNSANTSQDSEKKAAIIYAYRYLLNREPENPEIVEGNTLNWQDLRKKFLDSLEYKWVNPDIEMPYRCVQVEGITYFYNSLDKTIPCSMIATGMNWAKQDIENFINIADEQYGEDRLDSAQGKAGIFLDIGGNIGTTSIYCKLKLKPELNYIAFEPVEETVALLKMNCIINKVENGVKVEKIALSNEVASHRVMGVYQENTGGSCVAEVENIEQLKQEGRQIERVSETTLDKYLESHKISGSQIKYIWIDVEGYEPEVLEGATKLMKNYRIPCCIEFNQKKYKDRGCYEKMIQILEDFFDCFVTCQHVAKGESELRPISGLKELWDEFDHEVCDLILL